jgi:hypothetical protein
LRKNYLLQRVIEGKIKVWVEVTGRRGRRRRKLLDDLKERRGYCRNCLLQQVIEGKLKGG